MMFKLIIYYIITAKFILFVHFLISSKYFVTLAMKNGVKW